MATHSSVLAWRIPVMGSLVGCCLCGRTESDTTEVTQQQHTCHYYMFFMYTLSLQQTDEIDTSNIIPIFHMRKLKPSRIFFFFKCQCQSLGHVQLFVTLWTIAHLASCPWNSPGKNTGVACHFILQGIFLNQGLNPGLLNCRQILYQMSHQGSPGEALKSHTIDEIRIVFI